MIGSYDVFLQLNGTDPLGPTLATIPITSGTLSMSRSWAPAVRAQFTMPFSAFDVASWNLIEPTLSVKFAHLFIVNNATGDEALWAMNIRSYDYNAKAGTVDMVAYSYEALVQDYGSVGPSINFTDTTAFPSTLSIVRSLVQTAATAEVAPASDWTAPVVGTPNPSSEYRFVVPGTNLWSHVQALAALTPGGPVQHFGYNNDQGFELAWLITSPAFGIAAPPGYLVPEEPSPEFLPGPNDAPGFLEWSVQRSRDAADWGNAMRIDFPAQGSGSVVFTTSGYVMDYSFPLAGTAGVTSAKRRQVQASSSPRGTPLPADRDAMASQRLERVRLRAVAQTYTHPLDTRLLPWQRVQDPNSVQYDIDSVMHNLGDGTSVVTINRR